MIFPTPLDTPCLYPHVGTASKGTPSESGKSILLRKIAVINHRSTILFWNDEGIVPYESVFRNDEVNVDIPPVALHHAGPRNEVSLRECIC